MEQVEGAGKVADDHPLLVVQPAGILLVLVAVQPIAVGVLVVALQNTLIHILVLGDKQGIPGKQPLDNLPGQGLQHR